MADIIEYVQRFKQGAEALDLRDFASLSSLSSTLDAISTPLASDVELRASFGSNPSIYPSLRKLWRDLSHAQLTFWADEGDDDDEGEASLEDSEQQRATKGACLSLARFTRNLVAAVSENQNRAYENEPEIRRLLHYYTSWSMAEDADAVATARMLTQTLSNLVTGNDALMSSLWQTYLALPEDQVVLLRLLAHPDSRTILFTLIFILNIIKDNEIRIKALCTTPIGLRLSVVLLNSMTRSYDADEDTDAGRTFNYGYFIFAQIIEHGLVPQLLARLAMEGEVVTPHQTTLLKLTDSYLQSPSQEGRNATHEGLMPVLSEVFFTLSQSARASISRSVAGDASAPPAELDVMLPKVCEALVLLTQCIVSVALAAEGQASDSLGRRKYFAEARTAEIGMVESIVDLLRLLDAFLPRINFGKPVGQSATNGAPPPDSPGFFYLKRDLVRLLGVLVHRNRAVQDRVRECGGIQIVMNLCVVDERNPYLREHAIFTLHNLLEGNAANQALVDEIQPVREADENGVLKPVQVPLT
ncbi:hypothetical protein K525DRAFT_273327 [Schizophyllum commune Loenen D]|nr:hypothetical protein K525DRAFT_273327 [Schizophyllum commune Loenen D]